MKDTNVQFFTDSQARTVAEFAYNLYDEDRKERRKTLEASEEFKNKVKELRSTDYGKDLEKDKEILIEGFKQYSDLHTSLKNTFGKGSKQVISLLKNPHWYIGGKDKDTITLPSLPEIKLSDLPSWIAIDYAYEEKSEAELIKKIDEYITDRLEARVSHSNYTWIKSLWSVRTQILAIVATMSACDESQAIEKIIKKIPYDEVHKMVPSTENEDDSEAKEVCCEG